MKILQSLQRNKMSLQVISFTLMALVLAACGGNDDANKVMEETVNNANENAAVNEEFPSDENNLFEHEAEEIEYPALIPDDMPLPSDAKVTTFGDEEKDGTISVSTQLPLEELEALYDEFFEDYAEAEKLERDYYEEADHNLLSYMIEEDDRYFLVQITEYADEDFIKVHARYVIY